MAKLVIPEPTAKPKAKPKAPVAKKPKVKATTPKVKAEPKAAVKPKTSVRAATTGHITLEDTQTVNGILLAAGDRVLIKDQVDVTTNGTHDVIGLTELKVKEHFIVEPVADPIVIEPIADIDVKEPYLKTDVPVCRAKGIPWKTVFNALIGKK